MKVLINERLSQHKMKTDEGYLICTDAVLARTGKQQYRKADIWADSEDPDSIIDIDRRPEDVFADSTLASFENKPITIEHPDVDVNTENYHDYAVGFVRDVRKGKDGDMDVIVGDLVFTDQRAIDLIEAGEMNELSCGYNCDITPGDDPHQVNIKGNHVALCKQGRAGNARIIDSSVEDAAEYIEDSIEVEVDGKPAILLNSNAKPYGKVRPKVKFPDGRIVETYWDFIKFKDSIKDAAEASAILKEIVKIFTNGMRQNGIVKVVKQSVSSNSARIQTKYIDKETAEDYGADFNDFADDLTISYDGTSFMVSPGIRSAVDHFKTAEELVKAFNFRPTPALQKLQRQLNETEYYLSKDKGYFYLDSMKDGFYSEAEKQDKTFVKNALEEMHQYERNWYMLSSKRRQEIGCTLQELRQRIKELESVHDSIEDADDSVIDELIKDEQEAIAAYEEAMKDASEVEKAIYSHIIKEELEHIEELKNLKTAMTMDSIDLDDIEMVDPKDVDIQNYVIGKNDVWFAKLKSEKELLTRAFCSYDKGKTWHTCYLETKSDAHDGKTQVGKFFFRTSRTFPGPRTSIGRNVLTWYAGNGHHRVDEGYEIDHVDGNFKNDKLSNLELVSHAENIRRRNAMMKKDSNVEIKNVHGHYEGYVNGKFVCSGDTYKEVEDELDEYLASSIEDSVYDGHFATGTTKERLKQYLDWEGIYGYDIDNLIKLAKKGRSVLQDYLEEEGIFGYAVPIWQIVVQNQKPWIDDSKDSVKDDDSLEKLVINHIDHFDMGMKVEQHRDFDEVRKIAEKHGVGVSYNPDRHYVRFIYKHRDSMKDSVMIPAGSEVQLFHTAPYGSKVELIPGTFKYKLRKDYAAEDVKQLRELVFNEAVIAWNKKHGTDKGGTVMMEPSWKKAVVKRSDDSKLKDAVDFSTIDKVKSFLAKNKQYRTSGFSLFKYDDGEEVQTIDIYSGDKIVARLEYNKAGKQVDRHSQTYNAIDSISDSKKYRIQDEFFRFTFDIDKFNPSTAMSMLMNKYKQMSEDDMKYSTLQLEISGKNQSKTYGVSIACDIDISFSDVRLSSFATANELRPSGTVAKTLSTFANSSRSICSTKELASNPEKQFKKLVSLASKLIDKAKSSYGSYLTDAYNYQEEKNMKDSLPLVLQNAIKRGKLSTSGHYGGKYAAKIKKSEAAAYTEALKSAGYKVYGFESNPYVSYNFFFSDSIDVEDERSWLSLKEGDIVTSDRLSKNLKYKVVKIEYDKYNKSLPDVAVVQAIESADFKYKHDPQSFQRIRILASHLKIADSVKDSREYTIPVKKLPRDVVGKIMQTIDEEQLDYYDADDGIELSISNYDRLDEALWQQYKMDISKYTVHDSFIEDAEYVTVKSPYRHDEGTTSYKVSDYCVIKFPFYAFAKPSRRQESGYFPCKVEGYYRNGRVYSDTLVTTISSIYKGIEMFSCLTQSERAQDWDNYVGKKFSCYAVDVKNIEKHFKKATKADVEAWFRKSGYEVLDSIQDGAYDVGEAYYYAHTGDRVKIDGKIYEIDWREHKIGYSDIIDLLELPSRKPTTISKADFVKKAQLLKDSIKDSNIATKKSTGEKFRILKVPGDGFVYMTSLFDSRTVKAYEDGFKDKYKMKDSLPPYDDDVAYEIDDILEEMHIDYDGDIENGIAIPKSKVSEFERRLRQKGIEYREYHESRSSSSYQGISFFR